MGKIRLITTDLDGTFLLRGGPTKMNRLAVKRAREQGVRVFACTARPWAMAAGVIRSLDLDDYAITSNGAAVVNVKTGEASDPCPLPREWTVPIVRHVRALGYRVDLFCGPVINSLNEARTEAIAGNLLTNGNGNPAEFTNIRTFDDEAQWLEASADTTEMIRIGVPDFKPMPDEISEFIRPLAPFQITCSYKGYWDIGHPNASKEYAIARLCETLGLGRENVMAIGDSDNDIGMIQWAGVGVAMGNADQCVLDSTPHHTDLCINSGFAKAVYRYVLEQPYEEEFDG